jgi:aminoglycoside phosphotransferase (APT) family kinase protein|tara:strand:- start:66 stop:1358 length:1293 start_codon:yes stop_codon:yes gene_type:complete
MKNKIQKYQIQGKLNKILRILKGNDLKFVKENLTILWGIDRFFIFSKKYLNKKDLGIINKMEKEIDDIIHKKKISIVMIKFAVKYYKNNFKDININWLFIINKINKLGYNFAIDDLKISSAFGMNNMVRIIQKGKKKLFIKISEKRVNLQNECYSIKLINKYKKLNIPTADLLLHGLTDNRKYYAVYKFIEGKNLRDLNRKGKIPTEAAKILARIHQIKLKKVGLIYNGKSEDWYFYLRKNILSALENSKQYLYLLKKNKETNNKTYLRVRKEIQEYFRQHENLIRSAPIRLIHQDFNFHNILVKNNKIQAILDMEFSMAGDPAWDINGSDLTKNQKGKEHNMKFIQDYLKERKKLDKNFNSKDFLKRYLIYMPLRNLYLVEIMVRLNNKGFAKNFVKWFKDGFYHKFGSNYKLHLNWFEDMYTKFYEEK